MCFKRYQNIFHVGHRIGNQQGNADWSLENLVSGEEVKPLWRWFLKF